MEITEKLRSEIALSLPKLGFDEANEIARQCECSNDTVYREWRKLRGRERGRINPEHPVVLALGELAVKRKAEKQVKSKRLDKIIRQLSA